MTIKVTPLHPRFGAEVAGLDLSRPLPESTFEQLTELYFHFGVLLLRDQRLDAEGLAAFAGLWGTPKLAPRKQFNLAETPAVMRLGNARDERGEPIAFFNRQGVEWHSDTAGNLQVDNVTLLYSVEVPASGGGDTMFCSMYEAYDSLPAALCARIEGLRVLHSFNHHNDKVLRISPGSARPLTPAERAIYPDVWHELVQTHPMTGRRLYYVSEQLCRRFAGMSEEESAPLVARLIAHATAAERVYRHRWAPGDLLLWDNRAMLHSATEVDYSHERRLLLRASTYTHFTPRHREPWVPAGATPLQDLAHAVVGE